MKFSYYEKIGTVTKNIDDEIPFDIPDNWCWCRLETIGDWKSGSTPSRRNSSYYGGNIPWIKTGDLNNGYITDISETITQNALLETGVKLVPKNTVLIAMYGATLGKVGITTCEATTNQACCACCNPIAVSEKYLFYFLQSKKIYFEGIAVGGAQPNISKEKIVASLIPIPPLSEQNKIVDTILKLNSEFDDISSKLN